MRYTPVYNFALDQAFNGEKQLNRHTFSPMRYGLTQSQVDELKQAGDWDKFIRTWHAKRTAYLVRKKYACYLCNSSRQGGFHLLGKYICLKCCELIKEKVTWQQRIK